MYKRGPGVAMTIEEGDGDKGGEGWEDWWALLRERVRVWGDCEVLGWHICSITGGCTR
jgi:hypothetical protein